MNRPQLPGELKSTICRKIVTGEWSKEEAVTISGYTLQSLERWLHEHAELGEAAFATKPRGKNTRGGRLTEDLRQVLQQALDRGPRMRTRALTAYLRRHYGWKVPRRLVEAYLQEAGLIDRVGDRMERPLRRFEAPAPLDLVQTDLVYVPRRGTGWLYVLNVLDDHSRALLGSVALEQQTGKVVLAAFRHVMGQWGRPSRVLTDRGTQFVHWRGRTAFNRYVEDDLKAQHLVAAAKHPQTLGKIERFHRSLEEEGLDPKGYPTARVLQEALDRYRAYYNHERPHEGIGGLLPADRFYGMARPLQEVWPKLAGWAPDRSVFLTANLMGRRLVLAGPRPDMLRILWDDQLRVAPTEEA